VFTNHVWRSLVEMACYKMAGIPKNWDVFYDFFKGVQRALREQGMRHVYGLGFQLTTNGGDCSSFFNQFLSDLTGSAQLHESLVFAGKNDDFGILRSIVGEEQRWNKEHEDEAG
jgi:hypothetical protein